MHAGEVQPETLQFPAGAPGDGRIGRAVFDGSRELVEVGTEQRKMVEAHGVAP